MVSPNLKTMLQQHAGTFSAVVPFNKTDHVIALDFTATNQSLNETLLNDTTLFSAYIADALQAANARYGIGGYGEHRTIYSRSAVFDAAESSEPRRLHLGTDIWGAAGTPVHAPLLGTVHSFACNDAFGDYGATIILQHQLDNFTFHTLYGHLNNAALKGLHEGKAIQQGTCIAAFGLPQENGHWPPHLHFQIIETMQGKRGDYPGVCRYSERELYLQNCPDSDLILNLNQFVK